MAFKKFDEIVELRNEVLGCKGVQHYRKTVKLMAKSTDDVVSLDF
jgi:hypothetical protein